MMAQGEALCASAAGSVPEYPLTDKLAAYLSLTPEETGFLAEMHEPRRKLRRHREIIIAGRQYDHLFILCSGVACRYKVLQEDRKSVV
jgi:hypothetical protein